MLLSKATSNDNFYLHKYPQDSVSAWNRRTPDNHSGFVGIYFGNTLRPEVI